jgi:hypothetical protein
MMPRFVVGSIIDSDGLIVRAPELKYNDKLGAAAGVPVAGEPCPTATTKPRPDRGRGWAFE